MRVKRLGWLGTSTSRFEETVGFFRDVMGLSVVHEEPDFAMLQLPGADHDYVEVFGPGEEETAFYTTGPVVGLVVDDIVGMRAQLEVAEIELIGDIHWASSPEGYGWFHFRGPDGNVYACLQGTHAVAGM